MRAGVGRSDQAGCRGFVKEFGLYTMGTGEPVQDFKQKERLTSVGLFFFLI